jgi:hypothetical protein
VAVPAERILLSERQEDSSILGAAVLPIYDLLSPRFEVLQQDRRVEADVADVTTTRESHADYLRRGKVARGKWPCRSILSL